MSRPVAFLAGLAVALTAPAIATEALIRCQPVAAPPPIDCTLGGYFKNRGLPKECRTS